MAIQSPTLVWLLVHQKIIYSCFNDHFLEKFFIYSFGGSLSAVSAAIITNPLDVVKTRLQVRDYHSQSASLPTNTTTSITAVLRTIVKEEGYPALMRGTLVRSFPLLVFNCKINQLNQTAKDILLHAGWSNYIDSV